MKESFVSTIDIRGAIEYSEGKMHYYPHTSYTVYSEDGKTVIKRVANTVGIHDEDPSLVQLPVGQYIVLTDGKRIAVIIKPGQLTKVDLEHDWKHRGPIYSWFLFFLLPTSTRI